MRQIERDTKGQRERVTERWRELEGVIERKRDLDREIGRMRKKKGETQIEIERKRQVERERYRQRGREIEKLKYLYEDSVTKKNPIDLPGIPSTMKGILCPQDSISSDEFPKLPRISSKFNIALRTPLKY